MNNIKDLQRTHKTKRRWIENFNLTNLYWHNGDDLNEIYEPVYAELSFPL